MVIKNNKIVLNTTKDKFNRLIKFDYFMCNHFYGVPIYCFFLLKYHYRIMVQLRVDYWNIR